MSSFPDPLERFIDAGVALRNLKRFVACDGHPEMFEAAGLVHFECGHVRPMNVRFEPGETFNCLVCGPQVVVRVEMIEPEEFPAVDSLFPETDA